ncbi:MAG: amidohydrolase family protein [Planctomycetes bacterium]|nr:amidohydrolase family protein [Planctomycetota bacterium]
MTAHRATHFNPQGASHTQQASSDEPRATSDEPQAGNTFSRDPRGSARIFRARWLIPASGPVIEDGALVAAGGRIERVGRWSEVRAHVGPEDAVEHFPHAVLLPGFVNAHTHLALSDMGGRLRPTKNFAAWLARLTARLWARGRDAARKAVRLGVEQALAAGTVAVADMAHDPTCDVPADEARGRWTVFRELFRFGPDGIRRVEKAVAALDAAVAAATTIRPGLGPHAPYTAGVEVFLAARRAADARGWPLTAHLHETEDEIAFTERGEGTLHTWMLRLRILPAGWRPAGVRPIRMLADAGFFSGPVLVAHANYLTDDDIAVLAASGSSVAFCPRSHAFFKGESTGASRGGQTDSLKHADHPWRRLLAAGVNVCLGTDSLASSPSLSVLDEARFLFARGGADPQVLLEMATRRGARALGLETEIGDLRAGLAAEFCVIEPDGRTNDPLAAILAGKCRPARLVRA